MDTVHVLAEYGVYTVTLWCEVVELRRLVLYCSAIQVRHLHFLTTLKPLRNNLSWSSCTSSLLVFVPFVSVSILPVINSFCSR